MKQRSEARAFTMVSTVLALVVLISAGYEILMWSLDRNAWAEQQCRDAATRFEVCVGNVSSQSPFQIVRAQVIILAVVVVATIVRHFRTGRPTPAQSDGAVVTIGRDG